MFFPIIGKPFKFDLYKVPLWAWKRYYKRRQQLANEALATLRNVTDMQDVSGLITVLEAVRLCKEHGLGWRASTIQQHVSRGVLKGMKVSGLLHVDKAHLMQYLELEAQ